MDKHLAMTIIEALGEKICELKATVESLRDYCKYSDERCEKLIKRIHELEGFDSEKVRAECEEIANGEPEEAGASPFPTVRSNSDGLPANTVRP